jgi:hypothetical protein
MVSAQRPSTITRSKGSVPQYFLDIVNTSQRDRHAVPVFKLNCLDTLD